ncbi:uncharacterized protein LOC134684675 [Mytilus trossulus]|uniref:uncharacterized protein LOC134684675 n=1 Tax=Mytilus trossulus TaxID=6551 RepID=UPI003005A646
MEQTVQNQGTLIQSLLVRESNIISQPAFVSDINNGVHHDTGSYHTTKVSSGMFPHVQAVAPNIRKQILEGINVLPSKSLECKNLLSTKKFPDDVTKLVDDELRKGYLIGPFTKPPFDTYRISPIGIVEGKYSKKKRLILDLSAPHNNDEHHSINDLINKEDYSLTYYSNNQTGYLEILPAGRLQALYQQ